MRIGGATVNAAVMTSVITSVLTRDAPQLLACNGGVVDPSSRSLRQQFYKRHDMVKRAAMSTRKQLTAAEMKEKKDTFIKQVDDRVDRHNMPDSLMINHDETALPVIPTTNFTMEVKGKRNVNITGKDYERQVTGVIGMARDGSILPPQIIYCGKTARCHPPKGTFPASWHTTHTNKHWSTIPSNDMYHVMIIMRCITMVRQRLQLQHGQDHALIIFDMHKSNMRNTTMKQRLQRNQVFREVVPARMTDHCQVTLQSDL